MKICPNCRAHFEGPSWICHSCGFVPPTHEGIPILAPDVENSEMWYQLEYFEKIHELENSSFWFRSRNQLIIWALGAHLPVAQSMLEIGCGTGYVLAGIHRELPQLSLTGGEVASCGLSLASHRVPCVDFVQMNAEDTPFFENFDIVGAFDVIEHIRDDEKVLKQMNKALKQGGGLILTVPQHPFLWSDVDRFARHVRRYRLKEIEQKLSKTGFCVCYATSFVTLLLPFLLFSRLLKPKVPNNQGREPELHIPYLLDRMLASVMSVELALIRFGIRLRIGGSLLVVATKTNESP